MADHLQRFEAHVSAGELAEALAVCLERKEWFTGEQHSCRMAGEFGEMSHAERAYDEWNARQLEVEERLRVEGPDTRAAAFGVTLGVLPFDRSYWVVPGRLLAGFYPGARTSESLARRVARLVAAGVTHVVDLTEEGELDDYVSALRAAAAAQQTDVTWVRRSIPDLGLPTAAEMSATLDAIDREIAGGRTVYVHCWGGRGRTGTVVGCWLARHGMATGERCLQMIRYLRRTEAKGHTEAPETEAQKALVRAWKAGE